ncbi:MAG: prephenate dehydrogenase/arogenate dehydrogenase family protein [Nanoarchaeota archaeon]|nr:prephenate dehydrogenase/arogenate dehydrogenase family protein [Nanoarchaeota archaeon]
MKPKTISIIGGRGKMGSLFADAFQQRDYTVLVSNESNSNNIKLAQQGDVVIVSVPLQKTEEVIQEIGPYVRKEALLTDFTSVKIKPVAAMLKYSQAEVIGGHPLFGPSVDSFKGEKMVLCPERGKEYLSWYKRTMEELGMKIYLMTAEEHDKIMAEKQVLVHLSNLYFANTLAKIKQGKNQPEISTPAYILRLYAVKRMLSQDPSLYSGIFFENPFTDKVVRAYEKSVKEVNALVQGRTKMGLENKLRSLQEEFKDHPALRKKRVKIIDE